MKRLGKRSRKATKLFDHIRELQMRVVVSILALIVAGLAAYAIYEPLLVILRSPLDAPLYYSSPAGSFAFVMKICFMGALAVTIPIIIYNLIMFVRPAFEQAITLKRVYLTTILSAILAITGAVFGFAVIVPGALHFFAGFQVEGLSALISADSYLGFVTNVVITFVIMFQLPLLIGFIDAIKPLPPKKLLGFEKWVILGSLVVSLLVPFAFDFTTSMMIALPIVVLYNLSIIVVMLQHARTARKAHLATRAAVTKPAFNSSVVPESSLLLTEMSFEGLMDEVSNIGQFMPAATISPRRAGIDIRPLTSRPEVIKPAAWVHRIPDQIILGEHAQLISDIGRGSNVNHALASQ
ncbi:twin-arginine translocase subunit TatC [Candidatus Saccharibacteria bacterium]|nr:twin-arginine translocase subunit TatC [Candidatus Saccharibacteria bacterium]